MPRKETSDSDRARIVESYLDGDSVRTIARILGLKRGAVYSAISLYKNENRTEKKKRGGPRYKKLTEIHRERLREWVDIDCTLSLATLKQKCHTELNVDVCEKTIDRALSDFHFSMKRVSLEPVRRNDERNIEARVFYSNEFMRLLSETRENALFFIDEVGFTMNMRLKRGRSLIGTRAVQVVPTLRTRNISVFACMRKLGLYYFKPQTCPYNTAYFIEALRDLLTKIGNDGIQNAVFVVDNVPFHKSQFASTLLQESGHRLLFLPPYSPFLNPIENLFSKWKSWVKSRRPENELELMQFIEDGSNSVSADDCNGYYRHMLGLIARCINREHIHDA